MKRLIQSYDWIDSYIPERRTSRNKLPILEFLSRQFSVFRAIIQFKPDLVTSLFGSYCQSSWFLRKKNIIFTDSEFQHFNHRIAHPFATEIHTPVHFYKNLGIKQRHYNGIHEIAFLDGRRFEPESERLCQYDLRPQQYIVIRLSAWNTLHDINQKGIGDHVVDFVRKFEKKYRIVISAEENRLPKSLIPYKSQFAPEDFHHILAFSRFVLTEGASTASEAGCLGIPTVYINSTEPRGYLEMLDKDYGIVKNFRLADQGVAAAIDWLESIEDESLKQLQDAKNRMIENHIDVTDYVVKTLERFAR